MWDAVYSSCLNCDSCHLIPQVILLWWLNWLVYLWLLLVLLLSKVGYVWFPPNFILLRLHGLHLLWHFPNAWDNWFPCFLALCSSYIWLYQVREADHFFERRSFLVLHHNFSHITGRETVRILILHRLLQLGSFEISDLRCLECDLLVVMERIFLWKEIQILYRIDSISVFRIRESMVRISESIVHKKQLPSHLLLKQIRPKVTHSGDFSWCIWEKVVLQHFTCFAIIS